MDATEHLDRRPRMLRRIALLAVALMLATTSLSAFMRLTQSGIGCAEWPACYAEAVSAAPTGGHAVAAARLAHRIVASAALVAAIMMLLTTVAARPALRPQRLSAATLVALALALAALGLATPGARIPAVAVSNLLGGFAMMALCWRLAADPAADRDLRGLGAWGAAGLALATLQIALGALVGATHAALACGDLADCLRSAPGGDWRTLSPLHLPVVDTADPLRRSAAPVLLAHLLGAIVTLVAVAGLGALAWHRGRRVGGAALIALAAVQGSLGALNSTTALALPVVLLHNLIAALLLATLARLV